MNDPFFIGLDRKNPVRVVLGRAFQSSTMRVHDASMHYVSGGSGPAIIFLHGFSQDWYEFSKVMCLLAHKYTVIAVDLRGIGKSKVTRADYDAETQAHDIHELTSQLALKDPYLVGHDMGGMIAYAYARLYPSETRGVAILDGPLPVQPAPTSWSRCHSSGTSPFTVSPNSLNGFLVGVSTPTLKGHSFFASQRTSRP